jgi:hypothetical protein
MVLGCIAVGTFFVSLPHNLKSSFLTYYFHRNSLFCSKLLMGLPYSIDLTLNQLDALFITNFSVFIAGLLTVLDRIPGHFHAAALKAIVQGRMTQRHEVKTALLEGAFDPSQAADGTFIGLSKYTGKAVVIPDRNINQVALVLGTTGAGKTITLRRFYERAITANYPLIIVDGKPDPINIHWLRMQAGKVNKPFMGFNCENFMHYNCLAKGGHTELKDKIICLKDEWSSDYYKTIAEDYLQTTLEVLLRLGKPFDLGTIATCFDYAELILLARSIADPELMKRVAKLKLYDLKDLTGLQAHLNLLIHSELGHYFQNDEHAISLSDSIDNNALVYFALPALQFPTFASVLGKLIINDIKAVISQKAATKVFTIFDEFSIFAGEQVLNLVNMGRGKGIHAVFGTQGLGDLNKVSPVFLDQVMNCVNTLLCHRLNDQTSAQMVADWVGTQDTFALTAQVDTRPGTGSAGSIRSTKEYIIHPNQIKQELATGEAFYVSKVNGFTNDKIKVKYS